MGNYWDGRDILDIVDILLTLFKIKMGFKGKAQGQLLGWTGYPGYCGYLAHLA